MTKQKKRSYVTCFVLRKGVFIGGITNVLGKNKVQQTSATILQEMLKIQERLTCNLHFKFSMSVFFIVVRLLEIFDRIGFIKSWDIVAGVYNVRVKNKSPSCCDWYRHFVVNIHGLLEHLSRKQYPGKIRNTKQGI